MRIAKSPRDTEKHTYDVLDLDVHHEGLEDLGGVEVQLGLEVLEDSH